MGYIQELLPTIEHFHIIGYWLVFFVALIESLAFIGMFVPGSPFIILAGFLASQNVLDLGDVIWFAIMGAIVGDGVSYYLGGKSSRFFKPGNILFKTSYLEKGQKFFTRYGSKSILLGRFIGVIRPIVPFVAGMSKMPKTTFIFFNIVGAIAWGVSHILVGYFFGNIWDVISLWFTRAGIFIVIVVGIIFFGYISKRFLMKNGQSLLRFGKTLLVDIIDIIGKQPPIKRYIKRHPQGVLFLRQRIQRHTLVGLPLTLAGSIFIYVLVLLLGIVEDVVTSDAITAVDVRLENVLFLFRNPTLVKIFLWITLLGKASTVVVIATTCIIFWWLYYKRNYIIPFMVGLLGSSACMYIGKIAFQRPRPLDVSVYTEQTFSFPSGHATLAIFIYGFIAYFLWRNTKSWKGKLNSVFSSTTIIILIGFSRLYLGVHYLSDVLGGMLLGLLWLIVAMSITEWRLLKDAESSNGHVILSTPNRLVSALIITLGIVFYIISGMYYQPTLTDGPITTTPQFASSEYINTSLLYFSNASYSVIMEEYKII